jgi:hypothetical protein
LVSSFNYYGGNPTNKDYNQGFRVASSEAVPEPTSITLLISALLGLVGAFYLRRHRATA